MTKRPEKKISDILHDDTTQLGALLKNVFRYNQLDDNIEQYIPANIASHVRLGAYHKGKLILLAESGSWATKLSYMVPELRETFRKNPDWAGLKNIEVKVAPHLNEQGYEPPQPPPPQPQQLSQATKQQLIETAEGLPDTEENKALIAVLKRLGSD